MPEVNLPRQAFRHPEDALSQVRKAIAFHEETFGELPQGIWPSEGSVSPAVLQIFQEQGLRWTATDENILFRSLGLPLNQDLHRSGKREELLYRPFRAGGGNTAVFFRDHLLSDLVGFSYSRWDSRDAAADFVHRLKCVGDQPAGGGARVVSVILDGENAWEYYADGGLDFIRRLYRRLEEDPALRSTTFRDHLDRHPIQTSLGDIFTGSWINSNFAIWIGHREDNRAWDLLSEAREALVEAQVEGKVPTESLALAWEELYMAEGSDWCWWYGDDHTSGNDEIFDELYRRHLMNLYHHIGEKAPEVLLSSILEIPAAGAAVEEVTSLIAPRIDGRVSSYFEWLGASAYEIHRRGLTMHRADVPVSLFHYGIGTDRLFLRVDFRAGYQDPSLIGDAVVLHVSKPNMVRLVIPLGKGGGGTFAVDEEGGTKRELPPDTAVLDEILEAGIPWEVIRAAVDEQVQFHLTLEKEGTTLASWPITGSFAVVVPGEDFAQRMWSV